MEIKKKFVINAAFYGIILALVIGLYRYILPIMVPFLLGFLVAFIVQIPLNRMKLKTPIQNRTAAILLCIALYALVLGRLVLFVVLIVSEIADFAKTVPDLFQSTLYPLFANLAHDLEASLMVIDPDIAAWVVDFGRSVVQNLSQFVTDLSAGIVKAVASGAAGVPGLIIQIVITVVSSFFMSIDYRKIIAFIKGLIPDRHRSIAVDMVRYAEKAIVVYVRSYSALFFVTFLELWLGLTILRIPYAPGIAFAIALFDLMPILGTGGVLLPWVLIAAVLGNYPMAIGVAVLYIVITAVRNTLEPRLVGNQIGLHPLATLIAMILGLRLMGILGMALFPISLVAVINLKKNGPHAESVQS